MPNIQRSTWATLLFVGLLAPFAVVLVMTLFSPLKGGVSKPGAEAGTQPAGGGAPAGALVGPASPPGREGIPIFAAGDERTLWVAHPLAPESGPNAVRKFPAFEMLARSSNAPTWTILRDGSGTPFFWGYPKGLSVVSPPAGVKARAVPFVFSEQGVVQVYTASGNTPQEKLPADHTVLGTVGAANGVFALTAGVASETTTRPGDLLWGKKNLRRVGVEGAGTRPAGTMASKGAATQVAEGVATTAVATAPAIVTAPAASLPVQVNAYWFRDGHWVMLPAMGIAGGRDVPSSSALVCLAYLPQRLVAMWVEPLRPTVLVARSLDYRSASGWSEAAVSRLPDPVPGNTRLLPVTVDQTLFLLWAAPTAGTNTLELRGGRVLTSGANAETDLTLPAVNLLPAMSLKGAGDGLNPGTDVAAGPTENSIAVIVNKKDNTLVSYVFDDRGRMASGPATVEPTSPRRDIEFAQNIAMLLLILMLTLSFFQWKQRPGALKLPAGMVVARLGPRAAAFLIDVAIPYVAVCTAFGLWENDGYLKLISTGFRSILNLGVLFASPALMVMLGIYLAHVTIGELFFRRSIGKAITGLQILMVDGGAPTVGGTLVRNLIRLPELLLGILVIYLFISPHRQRLGDLIGRTLVISQKLPEVPAEDDKGSDGE